MDADWEISAPQLRSDCLSDRHAHNQASHLRLSKDLVGSVREFGTGTDRVRGRNPRGVRETGLNGSRLQLRVWERLKRTLVTRRFLTDGTGTIRTRILFKARSSLLLSNLERRAGHSTLPSPPEPHKTEIILEIWDCEGLNQES